LLANDASANAESALDALYMTALQSIGRLDDEDFRMDFCSVVGAILTARNPISDRVIDALLSLNRPSIHRLGCVLRWSANEPVRIPHPSFADFQIVCDAALGIGILMRHYIIDISLHIASSASILR
jgi:hypothetical protein